MNTPLQAREMLLSDAFTFQLPNMRFSKQYREVRVLKCALFFACLLRACALRRSMQ